MQMTNNFFNNACLMMTVYMRQAHLEGINNTFFPPSVRICGD